MRGKTEKKRGETEKEIMLVRVKKQEREKIVREREILKRGTN